MPKATSWLKLIEEIKNMPDDEYIDLLNEVYADDLDEKDISITFNSAEERPITLYPSQSIKTINFSEYETTICLTNTDNTSAYYLINSQKTVFSKETNYSENQNKILKVAS